MNFRKEDTLRFVFSDEKFFDFDVVCNSQNERMQVPSPDEADAKGAIKEVQTFPKQVMLWLGVSPSMSFEENTVDHEQYIQ